MNRRQSNSEVSSNDGTFDFNYKMDISGRKGKTGEGFNQDDGFGFDDFPNFREDRTQKSEMMNSQKRWLPSQINKKSEDSSFVGIETVGEALFKKKGGSFYMESQDPGTDGRVAKQHASPKFNEGTRSYRTIPQGTIQDNSTSQLSQISQPKSNISQNKLSKPGSVPHPSIRINQPYEDRFQQPSLLPHFSQKISPVYSPSMGSPIRPSKFASAKPTLETEYEDTVARLQYLQKEGDELDYETSKILKEIEYYQQIIGNNPSNQYELSKYTDETNTLNTLINQEKSLQRKLVQTHNNLEEEFDQLVSSVQSMRFQRPTIIKDQSKAIIDQINTLKAEFESFRRDQGSLNLSSTMQQPHVSLGDNRITFSPTKRGIDTPEDLIFKQYVRQINEYDRQVPNYLYNIKILGMKEEWKLFQNSQICLYCSYRDYPLLMINIGNKTMNNLTNFYFKEGASVIADQDVLLSKSYYSHTHRLSKFSQPFLKIQIKYSVSQEMKEKKEEPHQTDSERMKEFAFFLPVFTLKHGEFIPITQKQFLQEKKQHADSLEQTTSIQRPLDRRIIKNSIKQLRIIYPNLLVDEDDLEGCCRGIFQIWDSNDGALVKIKQTGDLVSIQVQNKIPFLLKSLEFLLTSMA